MTFNEKANHLAIFHDPTANIYLLYFQHLPLFLTRFPITCVFFALLNLRIRIFFVKRATIHFKR